MLATFSIGVTVAPAQQQVGDELLAAIPGNFQLAATQYEGMLKALKDDPLPPRTFEGGRVVTVKTTDWTSGFFAGSLWYLYEYTRKPEWLAAAKDYTERLESIKDFTGDHDVGFMLGCSYGNGYRLTGDKSYRRVLVQGAKSLATRFESEGRPDPLMGSRRLGSIRSSSTT